LANIDWRAVSTATRDLDISFAPKKKANINACTPKVIHILLSVDSSFLSVLFSIIKRIIENNAKPIDKNLEK
jgi:hypothetical protein